MTQSVTAPMMRYPASDTARHTQLARIINSSSERTDFINRLTQFHRSQITEGQSHQLIQCLMELAETEPKFSADDKHSFVMETLSTVVRNILTINEEQTLALAILETGQDQLGHVKRLAKGKSSLPKLEATTLRASDKEQFISDLSSDLNNRYGFAIQELNMAPLLFSIYSNTSSLIGWTYAEKRELQEKLATRTVERAFKNRESDADQWAAYNACIPLIFSTLTLYDKSTNGSIDLSEQTGNCCTLL